MRGMVGGAGNVEGTCGGLVSRGMAANWLSDWCSGPCEVFLRLYRLAAGAGKVSSIRPIGYSLLGYAVARNGSVPPIVLNTIVVTGVLMFAYSLNDYYDHVGGGESNFLGDAISGGMLRAIIWHWRCAVLHCSSCPCPLLRVG